MGQVVDGYLRCPLLSGVKDIQYLVDKVGKYNGEGQLSNGVPSTNKVLVVEAVADEGYMKDPVPTTGPKMSTMNHWMDAMNW